MHLLPLDHSSEFWQLIFIRNITMPTPYIHTCINKIEKFGGSGRHSNSHHYYFTSYKNFMLPIYGYKIFWLMKIWCVQILRLYVIWNVKENTYVHVFCKQYVTTMEIYLLVVLIFSLKPNPLFKIILSTLNTQISLI